ncbi:MAG: low molecular weight phosphatase family protein [Marmoricola sp.]|nr:low molecular weight phosphatase family protein [Marmoricola sp.]
MHARPLAVQESFLGVHTRPLGVQARPFGVQARLLGGWCSPTMRCVNRFRVLVVCVGNVCRSPLGERLLAQRLDPDRFEVASAGVTALVGSPMVPEAAARLAAYGGSAEGFTATQLTGHAVRESDLVLTATGEVRSRVLSEVPAAMRRTFTVRELAGIVEVLAAEPREGDGVPDPVELVARAGRERSRAKVPDPDVPDPYRRGEEAHDLAARLMAEALDPVARWLSGEPA